MRGVLRAAGHAHAVPPQRVRERAEHRARDRAVPALSACRASRSRGAARTSSPRSSRSSVLRRRIGGVPDATRGASRPARALSAPLALGVVAAPLAGAIGAIVARRGARSPPSWPARRGAARRTSRVLVAPAVRGAARDRRIGPAARRDRSPACNHGGPARDRTRRSPHQSTPTRGGAHARSHRHRQRLRSPGSRSATSSASRSCRSRSGSASGSTSTARS